MVQVIREKNIHQVFTASVLLKAANGALEIIGGTLLLFTGTIANGIAYLAQSELIEDPGDFLANSIQHYLPYLSQHSQLFAALYLLSHGIIKIFFATGLLRRKLWAYPSAIAVFIFFVIYQLYRYTYTHSTFLILLTIFDIFVIAMTWYEYRIMRRGGVGSMNS